MRHELCERRLVTHNPNELPPGLPMPLDDGGADHLVGARLPPITLSGVLLSELVKPTVLFFYPRTGVPGQPPNLGFNGEDWDEIPGARGCTPQSCGFRDTYSEFAELGVEVFGVSTQSAEFQAEFRARNHVPFSYLSDSSLALVHAMQLPTFEFPIESGGPNTLMKRMSWFVVDGRIEQVWYPVFPPNENAARVLDWLRVQLPFFRGVDVSGVRIRREAHVDASELARLYASSGIHRPHDNPSRLATMLRHSNLVVTARENGRLVGVARCFLDQAWVCFVADLAVEKERQRGGIGRALLDAVRAIAGDQCTVCLNAGPGAESYYSRVGFEPISSAWRVPRRL